MNFRSFLIAGVAAAACATSSGPSTSHVSAQVKSMQPGAHDATGIRPVDGATVALQCPNGDAQEIGKTSADGSIDVDSNVAARLDCTIKVSDAGFHESSFAVRDVCEETVLGTCTRVNFRSILQRSNTGSAGDTAAH